MPNRPSVLIIEDSKDLSGLFAEILEMNGAHAEIFTDGAEAMKRLAHDCPDLILLDMHLPHVSGMEILTYIRESAHLSAAKVVAITANALLINDLQDIADLTLLKPVSFDQISDLTSRLLNTDTTR